MAPLSPGFWTWLALCFLLAVVGTWWVRRYAVRRALYDHPGARRSHAAPTPRGGGLSIVIAMLVALALLAVTAPEHRLLILATAAGLCLVAGVGWVDDHRPLPVWVRLAAHLCAALLLAATVWRAGHGPWVAVLACIAVPVLVNVWNFMDGIDGLATSQAAIAAGAYALYSGGGASAALAWALAASCCGFLPFNFPKAGIFLGDVGSGALGYLLAALLVWLAIPSSQAPESWLLLLLPLSAFLIDASLTLARRIVRREPWWTAHVQHAYQQLAFKLAAHWPVTMAYAAWSLLGSGLLFVVPRQGFGINIGLAIGWLVISSRAWFAVQAARIVRS